jgi:hypothetical protein
VSPAQGASLRGEHLHSGSSYKRLEKGVFRLAAFEQPGRSRAELEAVELALILEGIDLAHARRRPRWKPEKTA